MPRRTSSAQNTLVQATVFKKCDRAHHNPDSNKWCAVGTCQHTCEPAQVGDCPHKWTVRYSVNSRQREQSFGTLTEAQTFQLTVSTGKQTQGAMFTDPRAGIVEFLPLCAAYVDGMVRAGARTKAIYRSNFANPAVTRLLQGRSVLEVARMDAEVKQLLNTTLAGYQDEYRGNIRRIIVGTLDECVRRGTLPRHTLTGIQLGPRVVTAEQYEAEQAHKRIVTLTDETVGTLAGGVRTVTTGPQRRAWAIPGMGIAPWLQRTMGLRIREALGVRKSDFKTRADGTRYLHLCWQATLDGRELEPLKHRKAGEYRDVPVPDMIWDMVQELPDGPLCPGPNGTPYMSYNTAYSRLASLAKQLGITGARTHMLRHQFASEAMDANPRELANISQVLGHDSVETTLKFYIHPSANAEHRIGKMMNARWTAKPKPKAAG
jgi:Phage integrase family